MLHFFKSLKGESLIFGDFNIDILINEENKNVYESLLAAYNFRIRNYLPTRIQRLTQPCINHVITGDHVEITTLQTTISDHFSVIAEVPLENFVCGQSSSQIYFRNLKNVKGSRVFFISSF